ncbi:hypothetical protein, partial [Pseudomonas sp. GM33]|uniref:hypothetical protein n=1 Tax=Pseudomonas sp. GM33 TaxID=1144329 RepID=UPI001EE655ED
MADKTKQDQKIAAFGSSYRETHSNVGAAEGGDFLILAAVQPPRLGKYPQSLWELACQRWRPDSRPIPSQPNQHQDQKIAA